MTVKERQPLTDRSNVTLAAESRTVNPARLKYDYSQIDEAHRERVQFAAVAVQDYMSRAAESIIRAGQELLEVKEVLPHGQFGDWIEVEFGMSRRTANNWMNAAKVYGGKIATVANLNATTLILLAESGTPDEARAEVEAQAQKTGAPPTRREVKRIIEKHKPAPKPDPTPPVYWSPDDFNQLVARIKEKLQHIAGNLEPGAGELMLEDLIEKREGWYHDLVHSYIPKDVHPSALVSAARSLLHEIRQPHAEVKGPIWVTMARPQDLADAGYSLLNRPGHKAYKWMIEREGGGREYGLEMDTLEAAIADARRFIAARSARGEARPQAKAVYTEPEPHPQPQPERYIVTLDAKTYHALRAAIHAGALRVYADRETRDAIKQAIEEAQHAQ